MKRVNSRHLNFINLSFLLVILVCIVFASCSKEVLAPAVRIAGFWSSDSVVTFYEKTDSCGSYQRYYSLPTMLNMTVIYANNDIVNVLISLEDPGNPSRIDTTCNVNTSVSFLPELRGVVSLTDLVIEEPHVLYDSTGIATGTFYIEVGKFSLNDNKLTGSITKKSCTTFCIGFETDPDKCKLTKKD